MLNDVPTPLRELTDPELNVTEAPSGTNSEVPMTPVTPVSAEAAKSIYNAMKQVPNDEASRYYKDKLLQKLLKATRLCFAERAILQGENESLAQINNED